MFVQVIRGKVSDENALRAADESWKKELKPRAKGYLGSTSGVADDGRAVIVARFDSEASARANSERPEQGEWFNKMSGIWEGEPTFHDGPTVDLFMGGGSDEAGFVQVMVYKPKDPDAARALGKEFEKLTPERPDILGGMTAIADDGTFINVNYFTSEKEAREGEKKEMPADMQKLMQRFGELAGDVEFIDLRSPWYDSA